MKNNVTKIFSLSLGALIFFHSALICDETPGNTTTTQTTQQKTELNSNVQPQVATTPKNEFTKEELNTIVNNAVKDSLKKDDEKQKEALQKTIDLLKKYKVTGYSFSFDPNFAFIWDTQNPDFEVTYKNDQGELISRKYKCDLQSIGWKFQLDFKLDFIFILDTDFNFYDSDKVIELGHGIDVRTALLDITYASFKNVPGGMLIVGIPLISTISTIISIPLSLAAPKEDSIRISPLKGALFTSGLAVVTGGTLTPDK